MKLTRAQHTLLERLLDRPLFIDGASPKIVDDLWIMDLINVIGKSAYITDAGRAAIGKEEGTVDKPCEDREKA